MEGTGYTGVVTTSTDEVTLVQGLADCQVTLNLLRMLRHKVLLSSASVAPLQPFWGLLAAVAKVLVQMEITKGFKLKLCVQL